MQQRLAYRRLVISPKQRSVHRPFVQKRKNKKEKYFNKGEPNLLGHGRYCLNRALDHSATQAIYIQPKRRSIFKCTQSYNRQGEMQIVHAPTPLPNHASSFKSISLINDNSNQKSKCTLTLFDPDLP